LFGIDPQQFTTLKQEVEKNVKALLLLSSLDGNKDGLNNVSSKSVYAAIQIATIEMTLETSGREGLGQTYKQE